MVRASRSTLGHRRQYSSLVNMLSMRTHVTKIVANCFASLRRLRSIRRSVSQSVLLSLVTALTMARLDYDCATLAGIPRHLMDRLQSVLNAAARLVFNARKYDHVSHLLRDLHWLRVPERIKFQTGCTRLLLLSQHGASIPQPRFLLD